LLCFYYNPNFKRDHPQLLARCKPRVGCKRRAPAASHLDEELEERCLPGSCHGFQPEQGTAAGVQKEAFAPAPPQ
ncbi:Heat shock transcription factor, Y-linked, partial [Phalacrocorax carbo]